MPAREIKSSVYCPGCCGIFCGFTPPEHDPSTPLTYVYSTKITTYEKSGEEWGLYESIVCTSETTGETTTLDWDGSPIQFFEKFIWNAGTKECDYSYYGCQPEDVDSPYSTTVTYEDPVGPIYNVSP